MWRAVAAVLTAVLVQLGAPAPAAADVSLPVAAVLTRGDRTALVVDLGASTRSRRPVGVVTIDGVRQSARLVPVMAKGVGVALVVDDSREGAATLPAWLSAAARFILEEPDAQATVITESAPATTIAPPQRGATGIVRALNSVRVRGDRDTATALALAARQFPDAAPGRRVVVLYTTAPRADGKSAAELAATFRAAGVILVVVGTATADSYWAQAATATGGFFAPTGNPVVVPALDQVETTLRGRYLVQFPTPANRPVHVWTRVDTGDLVLTGDAVVPAPGAEPSSRQPTLGRNVGVWVVIAVGTLGLAALLLLTRRRWGRVRPTVHRGAADPSMSMRPPARGRAQIPQVGVARGRARIPLYEARNVADPGADPAVSETAEHRFDGVTPDTDHASRIHRT